MPQRWIFVPEMKTGPLISIIMPVQNTEAYLSPCISSILDQEYQNWELIAVDDRSTDHSFDILERFSKQDSRIQAIKNLGDDLITALQSGYNMSTGAYITRMDSDDIMPKNKLAELLNPLIELGAGYVTTGQVMYFREDAILGEGFKNYADWVNDINRSGRYWNEIYKECVIPSACWMINRSDFDRIGAFDSQSYPEDYDLCFRKYKHQLKVHGVQKVLHHWRDRADRASRTQKEYNDNRFFSLKLSYFLSLDYNSEHPLFLWGAGKNGKDLAKILIRNEVTFKWVTDNPKKYGVNIYDVILEPTKAIQKGRSVQVIVAVSSVSEKQEIQSRLNAGGLQLGENYWLFV
jgi:glycosyltransferase involved in cell wall biosynthesis